MVWKELLFASLLASSSFFCIAEARGLKRVVFSVEHDYQPVSVYNKNPGPRRENVFHMIKESLQEHFQENKLPKPDDVSIELGAEAFPILESTTFWLRVSSKEIIDAYDLQEAALLEISKAKLPEEHFIRGANPTIYYEDQSPEISAQWTRIYPSPE